VIILDTNVLSATMQTRPDPSVVAWLDDQPSQSIWTTAVTVFEMAMGIELLEPGRRKQQLVRAFEQMLVEDLQGRIAAFDEAAGYEAGRLAAERQRLGRPVDIRDTQIAGIVLARRAALATRNLRHFQDAGITLIDPWADRS
jgi:hypothetical protein